jgi:hypothetical protein
MASEFALAITGTLRRRILVIRVIAALLLCLLEHGTWIGWDDDHVENNTNANAEAAGFKPQSKMFTKWV